MAFTTRERTAYKRGFGHGAIIVLAFWIFIGIMFGTWLDSCEPNPPSQQFYLPDNNGGIYG